MKIKSVGGNFIGQNTFKDNALRRCHGDNQSVELDIFKTTPFNYLLFWFSR